MAMKYVVYEGPWCDEIYVFSLLINHAEFVERGQFSKDKILGAGFVDEYLNCFGKSVSLNVASREDLDTKLLHRNISDY